MRRCSAVLVLLSLVVTGCEKTLLGPDAVNSSQGNFELLWKGLDENYALFTPRRINWDSLHAVYGSRVSAATTESQLWDIATSMLKPLNDGHVVLANADRSKLFSPGLLTHPLTGDFSLDLVKRSYLSTVTVAGAGYITYGRIKNSRIGYIYVASYASSGSGNGIDWAYDIDRAVQDLSDVDAMIMDVRNNGGGLRVTGNIINAAFIDRGITYFYQRLKTGPGHDDFGPQKAVSIFPRPGAASFTKRVALLTNRLSGSGAEYTAQLFRNLPYSTQIGDTTYGAFGEITLVAQLPNGWTYWYPCTLTTTPDGRCPEGIGIIPDRLVRNSPADIYAGRDRVMDDAVAWLSR